MRSIKGYLDEWRVQEYLLITFFISWLSWGILILLTALNVIKFTDILGIILFGIGGFGPTIAAIMCIEGKLSIKKIWHFIIDHKKKSIAFFLLFVIMEIAVMWLSATGTNEAMPWYYLPFVFIMCTLVGGGNEELGWRGTFQPVMDRVIGKRIKNPSIAFIASMIVIGVIWGLWHLPLWFVNGSTQQGMPFGWFMLSTIALSFVLGCVYRRTNSVLYCMLLHGLSNVLMSFFIIEVNWQIIVGFVMMVLVAIIFAGRPSTAKLQDQEKA